MTPYELADQNLRHICAVLGAAYSPDHKSWSPIGNCEYPGPWVRLGVEGLTFYILAGNVVKFEGAQRIAATCYYIFPCLEDSQTPFPEKIASALLLLKNDPELFDKWRKQDGPHV